MQQQQQLFRKEVTFKHDRRSACSWILNILWIVLGGWHMFMTWFLVGCGLCLTCIGCPCGCQCIKISTFLLFPFGKTVEYTHNSISNDGQRCCFRSCNCIFNILWAVTAGWILAIQSCLTGIVFCLTIVGIPFGIQCFKLTVLCFCPFGVDFTAEEETVLVQHYVQQT